MAQTPGAKTAASSCEWDERRRLALAEARMVNPQMVMCEEEFNQIQTVVDRLVRGSERQESSSSSTRTAQLIAASGEVDNIDTDLAWHRSRPATSPLRGGIAKLLRENEFATQFHEGEKANIHIQLVGNRRHPGRASSTTKSSLGLVRLRVTQGERGAQPHLRGAAQQGPGARR